ncbi:tetratricopeptide repeat protein [Treponema sp.]|uniref:tetratricopeptide repeat protein n=1 Tax=Treponema sp. TaxID=166 RepID=UPI003F001317
MYNESNQNSGILDRANAAILSRDYEQAARIYKGLLKSDPQNTELLSSLGNLYIKSGEDDKALSYFNEVVRLDQNNAAALNALGGIYRRLKKYDESISVLERAVIVDETDVQTFYNLGFTFKLMEKYDDALQCFNKVVEENPEDVLAFNHIGSIYALKNQHRNAVSSYMRGLKVDPNHPVLHLNLAKSYDALGEFEKSQSEYESALKTKPGWFEAIENYAELLLKKNKTRTAGEIVSHALNLNPKNADMHVKLGDVYTRQSDFDNAEFEYNEALKIRPEFPKALSGLANTYESSGRNEDAIEIMERMEIASPEDSSMLHQYAHILLSADRVEEAWKKIHEAYKKNPDDIHTLNLLGQYYICIGDERKALGCFKKIRRIAPDFSEFYKDGGSRYSQKGELKKAEDFFLKYISRNPENIEGLESIAKNYEAQGNLTKAMSSYRQIEQFDSENKAWKNGIERINRKLLDFTSEEKNTDIDLDNEFLNADEDFGIKIETPAEPQPEAISSSPQTENSFEPVPVPEPEFTLGELNDSEVPVSDVLSDGKLDSEAENAAEKNSGTLDDLVPDNDFLEENAAGLEEDETSAEDFFEQNPFSSGDTAAVPKENNFEPSFEADAIDLPPEDAPNSFVPVQPQAPVRDKTPAQENSRHEPAPVNPPVSEPEEEELPLAPEPFDDFSSEPEVEAEPEFESEPESCEENPSFFEDEILDSDSELPEEADGESDREKIAAQEFFMENEDSEPEPVLDVAEPMESEGELLELEPLEPDTQTEESVQNIQAQLFLKLKSLCNYLPEEQKRSFLESKTNLQLEYIISRLCGRKGLLVSAEDVRSELDLPLLEQETETGLRLLMKVVSTMRELVKFIQDEQLSSLLSNEIEKIFSSLEKIAF